MDEIEAWKVAQGVSMASDKLVNGYCVRMGLLVQDCELKESDYDYLRCEPARSALGLAVAHNWLKGLSEMLNSGENSRETQPLAVIKRGIDFIG